MAGHILITGSTGFVGRALLKTLADRGFSARGIGRAETGDLGPETDWRPWISEDVDCIVHLAGRAHVMRDSVNDPTLVYDAVNRGGTGSLAQQAAQAGVRRIIYMSSVKALAESGIDVRADDPANPQDDYGRSKLAAEQALAEVGDDCETVILRPPLIYGPGVKGNFARLLTIVDRGFPLPLGSVGNSRSLVSVANICDAVVHSMHADPGVYCPTDLEAVSTPQMIKLIAENLNKPARLVPFPVSLLKVAGRMSGKRDMVDRLTGSLTLKGWPPGWTPVQSTEDAFAEMVAWYRNTSSGTA